MEHIPKDIEKYLVKDEIVEKRFNLKEGCAVFATNKRLFIKKGNLVRDIDYSHISSIEFKAQRSWVALVAGILLVVLSFISEQWVGDFRWILLIVGIALFIVGFRRNEKIALAVVGLAEERKLSGKSSELDALFKLIREKRV